jgi:tetratricopeptide (TPR) repeat protein
MKIYTAVADASMMMGHTKEAVRFAEIGSDEALRQNGRDSLERAVALETLAQARALQKRYIEAEPLVREAMRIVDLHGGEISYLKASLYNTLGNLHAELGDIEGAQRQLDRSWKILEALPPCPFRAVVLHNLAAAALQQGRPQEARARLEAAMTLHESMPLELRKRIETSRSSKALMPKGSSWPRALQQK